MKYEDSIQYMEAKYDTLVDKFIEEHQKEWEEFCEEQYQTAKEQDFEDWDALYEQAKLDEMEENEKQKNI